MNNRVAFFQIYTHLNNVFELLSKAVVESKQKVNIPKLSKEEPEEKEESEKPKKEERGTLLSSVIANSALSNNSGDILDVYAPLFRLMQWL